MVISLSSKSDICQNESDPTRANKTNVGSFHKTQTEISPELFVLKTSRRLSGKKLNFQMDRKLLLRFNLNSV